MGWTLNPGPVHPCQQQGPGVLTCRPPLTPARRDSDHHREVQQLYEEMEQQILREKQQLQAEVAPPGSPPLPPCPGLASGASSGARDRPVGAAGRLLGVGPVTAPRPSWHSRERGWGELCLSPLPVSARPRSPGLSPCGHHLGLRQGSCPEIPPCSGILDPGPGPG